MYKDAILELPAGLSTVIQEFIAKGLTKYIVFDDQSQPVRIANGIHWFAFVPDAISPCLAYMRAEEEIIAELQALAWTKVTILAVCHIHGEYDPISQTIRDIYGLIQGNPTALATYSSYCCEPEFVMDGEGAQVANPLYGQFKVLGRWA